MKQWTALALLVCAACGGSDGEPLAPIEDAAGADVAVDASEVAVADVGDGAPSDAGADTSPAPPPPAPGESLGVDGKQPVSVPAKGEVVFRVETKPGEHVHFMLTFTPSSQPVVMKVERWAAGARKALGATDAGGGLRTLAVFDGEAPATFWVRITSTTTFTGTLEITRTPFSDGVTCAADCSHLLQLPLPNDPAVDGYAHDGGTVFRYQFGRRDLLMLLRSAGRRMLAMKKPPFYPYDLSQWNGETPGNDVGAPRHASHQRGKDVDVSLYGSDGGSAWRSFCTTTSVDGGRACVNGTAKGLDARATARELAGFYEGGIVTMMFLDQELIELVRPAAAPLASEGVIASSLVPLYSDGVHLQHWPNHDNHVHVRVSEAAKRVIGTEPIEPP